MASKKEPKELFPHNGFPYRMEDPDDKKKVCWFQCQEHLHKHLLRYNIVNPKVDVAEGHSYEPPVTKTKKPRTRKKTTTTKPKMSEVKNFHKGRKKK